MRWTADEHLPRAVSHAACWPHSRRRTPDARIARARPTRRHGRSAAAPSLEAPRNKRSSARIATDSHVPPLRERYVCTTVSSCRTYLALSAAAAPTISTPRPAMTPASPRRSHPPPPMLPARILHHQHPPTHRRGLAHRSTNRSAPDQRMRTAPPRHPARLLRRRWATDAITQWRASAWWTIAAQGRACTLPPRGGRPRPPHRPPATLIRAGASV